MSKLKVAPITLTKDAVLLSISSMMLLGKASPDSCPGYMQTKKYLVKELGHKILVDVHYNTSQVSTKVSRKKTEYWRKDSSAMQVDDTFDKLFEIALKKFGKRPDIDWPQQREEVEEFFLNGMKPVIGKEFTLTKLSIKKPIRGCGGLNSNSHDENGVALGGRKPKIQCQVRRVDKIHKMMTA